MVSHWSFSDSKSLQISWTLLSILADLNNVVVWMVSTHALTSKFSCPCINLLVTVPWAPVTIGISVSFMLYTFFFTSLARSRYLSFFSLSFNITLGSAGTAKFTIQQISFFIFFFFLQLLSLVVWTRLGDLFIFQNPRGVCASRFPGQILGWALTLAWKTQKGVNNDK